MDIKFLENEYWYGGAVHMGIKMPVNENSDFEIDLISGKGIEDQYSPLFISNKGRYIHSDKPFKIHFDKGIIRIDGISDIELAEGYENLRGA